MVKRLFTKVLACLFVLASVIGLSSYEVKAAGVTPSTVPIIEIKDYSVDGGMLTPGGEVTINLTLHNTSGSFTASDILMTVSSGSNMIYPVYGTDNQTYVGSIEPGASQTVAVRVNISSNFNAKVVDLNCNFEYQTSGTRLSNNATIVIPATGANTIGVGSITIADHAVVGGQSLISIKYTNQSNTNISDAKLVVEGNVTSSTKEIKLDTVYSNKTYLKDYYVCFNEAGNQSVDISLQYTDINGEECVDELGTFEVVVSKANIVEDSSNINKILYFAGRIICGLVGVVVLAVVVLYAKRK